VALAVLRRAEHGVLASAAVFAAGWIMLCTIGGTGHDVFGRQSSGALLAPAVKAALARVPAGTPFYSVGYLDHTLPFYVGHTTIMVANPDELSFGVSQEPSKWVPTVDAWIARWTGDPHALAVMRPALYEQLAAQHVPMRVIARDTRRVVVEKP